MTDSTNNSIPDVQSYVDDRHIAIDRVGIKDIRHPVTVVDKSGIKQHTVASFEMTVYLPEDRKGTHMSRFTQLLNDHDHDAHSVANFVDLFREMNRRLDSTEGTIEMSFLYFIEKSAPVTGKKGMLDYKVTLRSDIKRGCDPDTHVRVVVPVTTLCPCSKEISEYGAHNQRSEVTIDARLAPGAVLYWEDLIEIAEQEASCELYSQLKRSDEKSVTERAYDNPKFVEDLIRDVARRLNDLSPLRSYTLEVENFESIHNHSAYAMMTRDKDQQG
ncbi:MAG TPA: GTP cyclohydrolase I FolE2 [Gammaproteobacteria bacterium]|jgi:GTP cyclohydrolase I|nr:GTP cyclohydrolase I FolE2 [Gammaproteobacteria bacterium]